MQYSISTYKTERFKTREVKVGGIGIGNNNPIRIQSMTTSNTRDVEKTIEQIIRLADAGCEIARVTVQGIKEAESCEHIKNGLLQKGYTIPLVADIHFFPPAAFKAVEFVDKIRINPGNFVDKRASFKVIEYDDNTYQEELNKIEEKFTPLVEKCKALKKALRIGTNHGSLSDRIMNRFGDTPKGMVESALEFARICRKNDYHDLIFSMKASNPIVMIQAYRLLNAEMIKLGWDYPLHLGVTEAGLGEDGRVKSAIGIGSLLLDGLGDTIRVSLTEDPWHEIDPCKRLIECAKKYYDQSFEPFIETHRNFLEINKREVTYPKNVALHRNGTVIVKASEKEVQEDRFYTSLGLSVTLNQPQIKSATVDGIFIKEPFQNVKLKKLKEIGLEVYSKDFLPTHTLYQALEQNFAHRFSVVKKEEQNQVIIIGDESQKEWEDLKKLKPSLIFLKPKKSRLHYARAFFEWLQKENLKIPVILNFDYDLSFDDLVIQASAEMGALLCDGLGDGIFIEAPFEIDLLRNLSFTILQAARLRTIKTDFISCPSCGRTLFDLQDVTKRIRSQTSHLPGVKIAIMGCIVNGPGEMADADFGYVGSKPGKIDLYVGKKCVEKDIDFADADKRLIDLIKSHGRWIEKVEV
jgi:(E)-4-hydroxy-3-methylbut-2-enyl-diphosphate synthase